VVWSIQNTENITQPLLALAVDEVERSAARFFSLTLGRRHGTYWVRELVGHRVSMDIVKKSKIMQFQEVHPSRLAHSLSPC
jgi:hypothetical protein